MPLITDRTTVTATACGGGITLRKKPSANNAVPKPASPLITPPAAAPTTTKAICSEVILALYPCCLPDETRPVAQPPTRPPPAPPSPGGADDPGERSGPDVGWAHQGQAANA